MEILNKNKDFLCLYRKGQPVVSKYAVVYFRRNGLDCNRFGITAGKKVGNAVRRNRAKRIIRQAYRECEPLFPSGLDIVIVARASTPYAKSYDICSFLKGRALKTIKKAVNNDENS
jgi:ribonuclease P protein component